MSERFARAMVLAEKLHREQKRKGTSIPYLSHLLRVAGQVMEFGGDEDTAIAALLHDAVEDQGGLETARLIEREFGKRVSDFVLECSDSITPRGGEKTPWRERKEKYLAHIKIASPEARLISMCDKRDNLTTICRDLRREGLKIMARFAGGCDGTLWYYEQIVREFQATGTPGADEVARLCRQLRRLLRPRPVRALIGLGSNMGNRRRYLARARTLLTHSCGVHLLKASSLYETEPQGGPDGQRNFYNAVLLIETTLSPQELLARLQKIEEKLHRKRTVHWGPRTIDLDLLRYGHETIAGDDLILPHPRMNDRLFVLVPALEVLWK